MISTETPLLTNPAAGTLASARRQGATLFVLACVGFGRLDKAMVTLNVTGIGSIPIDLDAANAPRAVAELKRLSAAGNSGRLHRSEPLPPEGSTGPPYALVQFSLDAPALKSFAHEGTAKIVRGSVCLIGGASDLFISLARRGEHNGWETGMTIVGSVPEPQLSDLVEGSILALPKHDFKHPQYGTVMSMLNQELPCRLVSS